MVSFFLFKKKSLDKPNVFIQNDTNLKPSEYKLVSNGMTGVNCQVNSAERKLQSPKAKILIRIGSLDPLLETHISEPFLWDDQGSFASICVLAP